MGRECQSHEKHKGETMTEVVAALIWKGNQFMICHKVLRYLREQWPYLMRYLEDGRLELSNNRAERSIKPFVMGRKNWLFSNTPAGAQSSAVIYSLIETAKENDLESYRYLVWFLHNVSKRSKIDEVWTESFLPVNVPKECKVSKSD